MKENGHLWTKLVVGSRDQFQQDDQEKKLTNIVIVFKKNTYPSGINYSSQVHGVFGYFYYGFGLKDQEKLIKDKINKFQEEPKFRNKERSEPNPPEEDSDILETDSDPEETND